VRTQLEELERALLAVVGAAVVDDPTPAEDLRVWVTSPHGDPGLTDRATFLDRLAPLGWSLGAPDGALVARAGRTGVAVTTDGGGVVHTTAECYRDWFRPRGWRPVARRPEDGTTAQHA
jgi:hypothetical protein